MVIAFLIFVGTLTCLNLIFFIIFSHYSCAIEERLVRKWMLYGNLIFMTIAFCLTSYLIKIIIDNW